MRRLLFERFPALRSLPHIELAHGSPTAIEPLTGLCKAWDLPNLFIKREDQLSELYGGNKVRKLEFLLADAQTRGKRAVLTTGAIGSHHALATALFAAELGMRATLILVPQPEGEHVARNYQASLASGARVLRAPLLVTYPAVRAIGIAQAVAAGEGWPYVIPPGGSNALGALGYVEAGLELAQQIAVGACPRPDYVYIAVGSCASIAGLALGLGLAALDTAAVQNIRVVGVRVVPRIATSLAYVHWMQRRSLRLLRRHGAEVPGRNPSVPIEILADQLGKGYGHATFAGTQAQDAALAHEGLAVEQTYTAKTLAGLHAFATATAERRAATHLYVHTLGTLPKPAACRS